MSCRSRFGRRARSGAQALLICLALPGAVHGYAGEAGSGNGPAQAYAGLAVSTHHTQLTRALAYCAGFPALSDRRNPINPLVAPEEAQWAEVIALNDELTDQGTITGADADGNPVGPVWTNLNTTDWSYQLPSNAEVGCAEAPALVYPILQNQALANLVGQLTGNMPPQPFWDPQSGWFTHRFGPWAGQFHFPQDDGLADDLARLRAFATGQSTELEARSLYGFGAQGANTWSGSCYDQRLETLATGSMKPGSVEAFATYLHSLGDSYSHRMCREHWQHRQTPPWYYHTPANSLQATCAFNDHTFEFGCPDTRRRAGFLEGTVQGAIAVFDELVGYALANGFTPRVPSVDAYGGWLRRQLERYAMSFKNNYNADAGACRVSYTYALLKACGAITDTATGCLPDVDVADGGTCEAAGQTSACPEGTEAFPMTPTCAALQTAGQAAGAAD
ncbi:MAG: hypothetical protein KDD47_20505 [Acidobacteria bacterium]|nr:hypothetical protein [Acidobacteriota bacterium]